MAGVRPQDFPEPRLEAPQAEQPALPPPGDVEPPVFPSELESPPAIAADAAQGADEMDVDPWDQGDGVEPMTIDRVQEGEGAEEEEGDMWLNNLILQSQADMWNTFCLKATGMVLPVENGLDLPQLRIQNLFLSNKTSSRCLPEIEG